jgi:hypothetical protein
VNLFAPLDNPNCCLIVTRDGGHAGFASASADYEYSLIRAFFDPKTAPHAAAGPSRDAPLFVSPASHSETAMR